jgi:hypothetical protein
VDRYAVEIPDYVVQVPYESLLVKIPAVLNDLAELRIHD